MMESWLERPATLLRMRAGVHQRDHGNHMRTANGRALLKEVSH
jgi:hypothetical protein